MNFGIVNLQNEASSPEIQLSDEQLEAISKIKSFLIESDEIAFSLMGSAGTGKTLVMNTLCKELQNLPIALCAPTHKAKLVLEKSTKRSCITLHSLLALNPIIDIFELDFNDLLFKSNEDKVEIPKNGLVICDEASMINDDLFKALIKKCSERKSKILFVSDEKQLRPVKSERESLVYTVKNQFRLTKIFRQSDKNALLPILEILRNRPIEFFQDAVGEEGSLICEYDIKKFVIKYLQILKTALEDRDILRTKLTAFTNSRVDAYNILIKQALFPEGKEYNKGEFLTCYDNFKYLGTYEYFNSMDYIIDNDPILADDDLPYFDTMKGWKLKLYDSVYKCHFDMFILSKDNSERDFNRLAYRLEELRIKAIKAKGPAKVKMWGMYFALNNSFATPKDLYLDGRLVKKKSFAEGYACTTHKLQGSTLDTIFVDMKNINSCIDKKVRQQLQYVALSRTRTDAVILQ